MPKSRDGSEKAGSIERQKRVDDEVRSDSFDPADYIARLRGMRAGRDTVYPLLASRLGVVSAEDLFEPDGDVKRESLRRHFGKNASALTAFDRLAAAVEASVGLHGSATFEVQLAFNGRPRTHFVVSTSETGIRVRPERFSAARQRLEERLKAFTVPGTEAPVVPRSIYEASAEVVCDDGVRLTFHHDKYWTKLEVVSENRGAPPADVALSRFESFLALLPMRDPPRSPAAAALGRARAPAAGRAWIVGVPPGSRVGELGFVWYPDRDVLTETVVLDPYRVNTFVHPSADSVAYEVGRRRRLEHLSTLMDADDTEYVIGLGEVVAAGKNVDVSRNHTVRDLSGLEAKLREAEYDVVNLDTHTRDGVVLWNLGESDSEM